MKNAFVNISKSLGYAIHSLIYLAIFSNGQPIGASEVAKGCGLSVSYMMKILQVLKRAGILKGTVGVKGGYILARKPEEITLYDLYSIFQPPERGGKICFLSEDIGCVFREICLSRAVFAEINEKISDILKSVTLANIIDRFADKVHIFFKVTPTKQN